MGRSVFLIEDSPTVVHAVSRYLEAEGFEVIVPGRFLDIPTLIDRHAPQAIILDLNMPAISGEQIAAFLQRNNYRVPIIVYSGDPREQLAQAARRIGAVGYVQKGDSLALLREMLEQAVAA